MGLVALEVVSPQWSWTELAAEQIDEQAVSIAGMPVGRCAFGFLPKKASAFLKRADRSIIRKECGAE